jgi:hypothetical protein
MERAREVTRENVPAVYTKRITFRFLTFPTGDQRSSVPLNQKNYTSLYLILLYVFPEPKAGLDNSCKNLKQGTLPGDS